jgi:[protein-PII] uridylyltransferase
MPTSTLRPCVLEAKQWLAEERAKLKQQHDAGSPGIQVCTRLTDLLDGVILKLYEAALSELPTEDAARLRDEIALVALGGYGRHDVAPFSDVDLMILHTPQIRSRAVPFIRRLTYDIYDTGLTLGQSVRTIADACKMGLRDSTIFTSLVEARFLAGSEALFERFQQKFQTATKRHWRGLVSAIHQARSDESRQFGETIYLLEPNIKRSPGTLRDIQLLRWVGFARYGHAAPDSLQLIDALPKTDQIALLEATEFLLRTRNELHFHAGKAQDVLDRSEQVRMAAFFAYPGAEGIAPVEQFMQDYFRHTGEVRRIVPRFVEGARPWSALSAFFAPLLSHTVEGDFRVGPKRISATRRGLKKLRGNLDEILRLADVANLYDKRIAHGTWETVRRNARELPDVITPQSADRFLSLLSQPGRLGELLRNLHELEVLEKLIPAFAHARSLLQFNEYHKFTVDEHCLRAVEAATSFFDSPKPWGDVYRSIKKKRTLHLALLIHDLGKGFIEDHSEVGLRIADETARRFRLPRREAETLKFLVHKHLMMSHLAFRRDTSDDQVIVRFAVDVGSAEVLSMLFVLTCADLAAVGPDVFNSWKGEVLYDLYLRTLRHLAGDSPSRTADERRAVAAAMFAGDAAADWYRKQIEALPTYYLIGTPPQQIAIELSRLRDLQHGQLKIWHRYLSETKTIEYTIGAYEDLTPGIFHKLTGGLSSQGLQILSADINTLADGLVLDRFRVQDPDFTDEPSPERQAEIERRLTAMVKADQPPAFRRIWNASSKAGPSMTLPTQVRLDNNTSERFTVVDVFASDRMGLLYTITRTLFECGLSVAVAKIGTYLDQVVDVFYVTDQAGRRIEDEERLEQIRLQLLDAISQLEREPAAAGVS